MNTLAAIKETWMHSVEIRKRMQRGESVNMEFYNHSSLGYYHVREMHDRVMTEDMSEAKLNRWLGWMQAAIVTWGLSTVEEMKEINRRHS